MKEIMSDENQSIETTIEDDKQSVETLNKITEEVINYNKTEIEIISNDQNREQVSQKIENNGIKKQIIKKTEERRITHPKKIKNTREELEMTNNGLINVLNILSTDSVSYTHLFHMRKFLYYIKSILMFDHVCDKKLIIAKSHIKLYLRL